MGGKPLNEPVVGMAGDAATGGYWEVAADGGIFSFDAPFLGSTGSIHLNQPIVGMEGTPNGLGYRFVAADGGIFSYGTANFDGSTGGLTLVAPMVAMAADDGNRWVLDGGGRRRHLQLRRCGLPRPGQQLFSLPKRTHAQKGGCKQPRRRAAAAFLAQVGPRPADTCTDRWACALAEP